MFKKVDVRSLPDNLFKIVGDEWMLITAGNREKYNMMTASWGFFGIMWGGPCAIACIRPQRYTMEFVEREDYYTLSFYGDNKKIHSVCGKMSGRDVDKTKECGMHPVFDEETGAVYFEEARCVLICRKKYDSPLVPEGFPDKSVLEKNYGAAMDLHHFVIGEIVSAYVKE